MRLHQWRLRYQGLPPSHRRHVACLRGIVGVPLCPRVEDSMCRVIMMTMLAVGTMTAFQSFPARAQYAVCLPARGCLPTTQSSYNACYQLALQRGWNESDNVERDLGSRGLDRFIYLCLAGKIPRTNR